MQRCLATLAGALALCSSAFAQDATPFVGTWSGQYTTEEGFEREAELVIRPDGGTWKSHPKGSAGRNNPCFSREFPVFIQAASPTDLSISVKAGTIVPGCVNLKADLRLVAPARLEGKFRTGRPLSFEKRQPPT